VLQGTAYFLVCGLMSTPAIAGVMTPLVSVPGSELGLSWALVWHVCFLDLFDVCSWLDFHSMAHVNLSHSHS
jgi:hypothetical protein